MPLTMKQIRDLPGETRQMVGYLDEVVVQEPTDKDKEKAAKAKPPYTPQTKHFFVFSPNRLDARKVKFDPKQFPVDRLRTLEAACLSIELEVRTYEFNDKETGEVKKGETAELVKLGTLYRDANGEEPKPRPTA